MKKLISTFTRFKRSQRGAMHWAVAIAIIVAVLVGFMLPVANELGVATSIDKAIQFLEGEGYHVFGAGTSVEVDDLTVNNDADVGNDVNVTGDVVIGSRTLSDSGSRLTIDGYNIPRTATLVVAANDASAASKSQADYVCDGTADDVEIQAAVTAINALGGGSIILSEGTFTLAIGGGSYAVNLCSNLLFEGQGYATKITIPNSQTGGGYVFYCNGIQDFQISNMLIDGNLSGQDVADEFAFEMINLLNTCSNGRIENITFENVGGDGVDIDDSTGITLSGIMGYNVNLAVVHFSGGAESCVNTGGYAYQCGTDSDGYRAPFDFWGSQNCVHQGCVAIECGNGFYIKGDDTKPVSKFNTFNNCIAIDSEQYGFLLGGNASYGYYNTLSNCVTDGSYLSGYRIELPNNTFETCKAFDSGTGNQANDKYEYLLTATCNDNHFTECWAIDVGGGAGARGFSIGSSGTGTVIIGGKVSGHGSDVQDYTGEALIRSLSGWIYAIGDTYSILKTIDHASLTDNGDATAYMDFDDAIPAGSVITGVKLDYTQAFNSDDTTTLTVMIGYVGDLDAFSLTAAPGDNAFNHTTDAYWGQSDCQAHIVSAAKTPRVTFTEDDDGTDIINSANAQGTITITITYMKV